MSQRDYRTETNSLPYVVSAGESVQISPATATSSRPRNYLIIQVTGLNAAVVNFGEPASADQGITIGGGSDMSWTERVPQGSINIFSMAGTTISIIEGKSMETR